MRSDSDRITMKVCMFYSFYDEDKAYALSKLAPCGLQKTSFEKYRKAMYFERGRERKTSLSDAKNGASIVVVYGRSIPGSLSLGAVAEGTIRTRILKGVQNARRGAYSAQLQRGRSARGY